MIRFIDLRYQGTCYRFAFWDTVTDSFDTYDGEQAWKTWDDFEAHFRQVQIPVPGFLGELSGALLTRYRDLCPPWAFEVPVDKDEMYGFRKILFGEADS